MQDSGKGNVSSVTTGNYGNINFVKVNSVEQLVNTKNNFTILYESIRR